MFVFQSIFIYMRLIYENIPYKRVFVRWLVVRCSPSKAVGHPSCEIHRWIHVKMAPDWSNHYLRNVFECVFIFVWMFCIYVSFYVFMFVWLVVFDSQTSTVDTFLETAWPAKSNLILYPDGQTYLNIVIVFPLVFSGECPENKLLG